MLNIISNGGTSQYFLNNLMYKYTVFPAKDIVNCCSYPLKTYDYSAYYEQGNTGMIKYIITYVPLTETHPSYIGLVFDRFERILQTETHSIYRFIEKSDAVEIIPTDEAFGDK